MSKGIDLAWVFGRKTEGSHLMMRRGESGCVVPMHKELKTGTLAGVLRQAGVSVEEFIDALR